MQRLGDLWYVDDESASDAVAPESTATSRTHGAPAGSNGHLEPAAFGRSPLPSWARFMVDLGSDIALVAPDTPTTVVVSLPTRDFAAASSAAAVVVTYDELDPAAPDNLAEHLEALRSLEPRTRVQYQENGLSI